jgi:NADPH-dependent 2,4-dienoyl-CoA reductase/sulfur reductase-like enzyme
MESVSSVVIVGAGLAGDSAAAELRSLGYTGRLVIIGDEPERPYDRPPLSKAALLNHEEEAKVYLRAPAWYEENRVELMLNDACVAIDTARHELTLQSGAIVKYSKLLIATGARPRRLPMLEDCGAPVLYLRSLADARQLRNFLKPGANVAIVGGGVIGMEVAATAAQLGCSVTVIEAQERIMARSVSAAVSSFLTDRHAKEGVRVLANARIAGEKSGGGKIVLESGETVTPDVIIAGIGAQPNAELAEAAGLRVEDGIVVDRYTRTSDPDVHAAGDVTRFDSEGKLARAEHWRHAIDQALVSAHVMLGKDTHYVEQPWVWSDQYDLNIQIFGEAQGDSEVIRGAQAEGAFVAFAMRNGRVVGATAVNQAKHKRALAALVHARANVPAEQLADPAGDLKALAAQFK